MAVKYCRLSILRKGEKVMMTMNKKSIKNRKTRKTSSFYHGLIS